MKRLLTNNCDVLLSICYKEFETYTLIVNYVDVTAFGNEIVKLTLDTTDVDLINRIKYCEDESEMIQATKEGIMLVLNENCKCCKEIKHETTKLNTRYYFEEKIQMTFRNMIKDFINS